MSQGNLQKAYLKKSVQRRRYQRNYPRPKSKPRNYSSHYRPQKEIRTSNRQDSLLQSLSSIDLVSILNSFYTVRSTVKDLRVSLEKLDSVLDSAYQMFEIAQGFINRESSRPRRPPLRLLPSPGNRSSQAYRRRESPGQTERPSEDVQSDNPLAGIFENIDMEQIISLMQSPLVQGLLKQFSEGNSGTSRNSSRRQRAEGDD